MRRSLSSPSPIFVQGISTPHPDCFSFSKNCTIVNPPLLCELKYGGGWSRWKTFKSRCVTSNATELTFLQLQVKGNQNICVITVYLNVFVLLSCDFLISNIIRYLYWITSLGLACACCCCWSYPVKIASVFARVCVSEWRFCETARQITQPHSKVP